MDGASIHVRIRMNDRQRPNIIDGRSPHEEYRKNGKEAVAKGLTSEMKLNKIGPLLLLVVVVLICGRGFFRYFGNRHDTLSSSTVMKADIAVPKVLEKPVVADKLQYPKGHLELFNLYHSKILRKSFNCKQMRRFGNAGDGGWEMCVDEPYTLKKGNCLVYSFGIANDYSFDDHVAKDLNCEIHAFDPSIGQKDYKRGNYIQFHNLGVSGTDFTNKNGWKLMTVDSIMKSLGHENRIIDYFKIDVESSEWDTLAQMMKAGTVDRVKQIGIEYHINNAYKGNAKEEEKHMIEIRRNLAIFDNLEAYGFKIYHFHTNMAAPTYVSSLTGKTERCCQEIYYVNTRFIEN
ncbi:putative methyltransferase-like protein 24 [Tubulanus polymorphus]|uniref:putative methyltransferase-like protein 24 n=1 Tax=Tubulanus polymorphus TaxID=672921 RepID=UPI003DA6C2AD